jgi:hypothetical protein
LELVQRFPKAIAILIQSLPAAVIWYCEEPSEEARTSYLRGYEKIQSGALRVAGGKRSSASPRRLDDAPASIRRRGSHLTSSRPKRGLLWISSQPLRLTLLLIPILAGCGTLTHGPLQQIHVNSDPPDAIVRTNGCGTPDATFNTPGTFWASRRADGCTVRISVEGYEPFELILRRAYSGAGREVDIDSLDEIHQPKDALVVLAFLGVLAAGSAAIDWATGGMYELLPPTIAVRLSPVQREEFSGNAAPGQLPERRFP